MSNSAVDDYLLFKAKKIANNSEKINKNMEIIDNLYSLLASNDTSHVNYMNNLLGGGNTSGNKSGTPATNPPASQSGNKSGTPATNPPATPPATQSGNKSATPATNPPATPPATQSGNKSATPATNPPATPSGNKSATPSGNKSATPSGNKSATPATNPPATPEKIVSVTEENKKKITDLKAQLTTISTNSTFMNDTTSLKTKLDAIFGTSGTVNLTNLDDTFSSDKEIPMNISTYTDSVTQINSDIVEIKKILNIQ